MFTQKTLRAAINFAQTENPKISRGEYPIKMMELFQNNNTSAQCLLCESGPLTLYQYKAVIGVKLFEKGFFDQYVAVYMCTLVYRFCHACNSPFPSSCLPPLQSESKCEVFVMVICSTLRMNEN